jgi:hypothetical protein
MVRLKDADALRAEMERAGFRDVLVHRATGAWSAPSADWVADNAGRLFRQMPAWASLDGEDRERLRERFRRILREIGGSDELHPHADAHVAVSRR